MHEAEREVSEGRTTARPRASRETSRPSSSPPAPEGAEQGAWQDPNPLGAGLVSLLLAGLGTPSGAVPTRIIPWVTSPAEQHLCCDLPNHVCSPAWVWGHSSVPMATPLPNLPLCPTLAWQVSAHVLDASRDAADGSRAIEAASPAASGEPGGWRSFLGPKYPGFSHSPRKPWCLGWR